MPTIHGYIGAGKTTFARTLEQDLRCLRFTNDEWMSALYGDNPPEAIFRDCEDRIKALIWQVAQNILALGHDVIIDSGAWKLKDRDDWRRRAQKLHVDLVLYNVTCPLDVAKRRALQRTRDMPAGALVIDENAFDVLYAYFEPVDVATECCTIIQTG